MPHFFRISNLGLATLSVAIWIRPEPATAQELAPPAPREGASEVSPPNPSAAPPASPSPQNSQDTQKVAQEEKGSPEQPADKVSAHPPGDHENPRTATPASPAPASASPPNTGPSSPTIPPPPTPASSDSSPTTSPTARSSQAPRSTPHPNSSNPTGRAEKNSEPSKPEGSLSNLHNPPGAFVSFAPPREDPLWAAKTAKELLSGFIQLDYLHRELSFDELGEADRKPLNNKRFMIRNARLRLRKAWEYFALQSEVELFTGQGFARPVNLELRAKTPKWLDDKVFFEAQAGLFPVAFGFEMREQGHPLRFFGERSDVSRAFIPGRFDIGVGFIAHLGPVDWTVALQNGQPLGAPGFSYLDPNRQKDFSTRLRVFSDPTCWLKIRGGASYLRGTGFSGGTPTSKDSFEWIDLDQDGRVTQTELLPIVGSAGRPSENFKRWAVGADVQVYAALPVVGRLALYAEGAWGQNMDRAIAIADPVLLGRDQRSFGYYVGIRQELTRFFEIGGRYQHYEPNADRLELFEGLQVIAPRSFQTWSAGAAIRYAISPEVRTRLFGEYEWQKNSLGRNPDGRPGPLDNDTFRLRWELVF